MLMLDADADVMMMLMLMLMMLMLAVTPESLHTSERNIIPCTVILLLGAVGMSLQRYEKYLYFCQEIMHEILIIVEYNIFLSISL